MTCLVSRPQANRRANVIRLRSQKPINDFKWGSTSFSSPRGLNPQPRILGKPITALCAVPLLSEELYPSQRLRRVLVRRSFRSAPRV
jgi:hypothetical protein